MTLVLTSIAADRDILGIVTYIATDSPISARRFGTELNQLFHVLADQPDIGQPVGGFAYPLRAVRVSARFRKYRVFYRHLNDNNIEIVRVLHGARNISQIIQAIR
jgi:plasmid stabilization system protein ParE